MELPKLGWRFQHVLCSGRTCFFARLNQWLDFGIHSQPTNGRRIEDDLHECLSDINMLILAHWYLANNPYPRNHWWKYTSSSLFQDVSKASTTPRSVTGTEWSQTPTKLFEKKRYPRLSDETLICSTPLGFATATLRLCCFARRSRARTSPSRRFASKNAEPVDLGLSKNVMMPQDVSLA